MRKTNEEFQTEVFRRSAAYRKKMQQRRKIVLSSAAACLLIAVSSPFWLFRSHFMHDNADSMHMTTGGMDDHNADNGVLGGVDLETAAEGGYVNEQSEAYSEEATNEVASEEEEAFSEGESVSTQLQSAPVIQENSESDTALSAEFRPMSNETLWQYYGIAGLPEQIGGFTRTDDRTNDFYHGTRGLGISYSLDDFTVLDDENVWVYTAQDGQAVRVFLSASQDGGGEGIDYSEFYTEDRTGETAYFSSGAVFVYLEAFEMAHEDIVAFTEELYRLLQEGLS